MTRSKARAERESALPPTIHIRNKRTREVHHRGHIKQQGAEMGRRGGNSSRGTPNRRKPVRTSEVSPIRLFSAADEENREDEGVLRVSLGFIQLSTVVGFGSEVIFAALHQQTMLPVVHWVRGFTRSSI